LKICKKISKIKKEGKIMIANAVAAEQIQIMTSGVINKDRLVDLLSVSEVLETVDAGHSLVHKAVHPIFGLICLIDSALGSPIMVLFG
jgi:hypothetical protein